MKIGYYVQGDTDEAVVWGLAKRWCPDAELDFEERFRGASGESFRREISKSLLALKYNGCDILVVLTDADANPWREVKKRESAKIPTECEHLTLFGVADRNIECWLAIDRDALACELKCPVEDIPSDDPSHFVKRKFGLTHRDEKQEAKARVRDYVAQASLRSWIEGSNSFRDFYGDARRFATQNGCLIKNELNK